ncbi:hypothetical protein HY30_12935 [Hyphomonas chukchiensis]|uniref:Uncharacterized protein n=2 Tax=Hyphomonas chukchiensis TaxID=1280947 RepID=A0A062UQQ5_9PROT|nr:hypothetical protein HY30_12935 [Hyphomonas chukchiensis]
MKEIQMTKETADKDPQREQDLSEQRGYGETPGRKDETAESGFRRGEATDMGGDHGVLRDDGQPRPEGDDSQHIDAQRNPVVSPRDQRMPNTPDTLNADKGSRKATPGALKAAPDNEILEDAYSKNDPGVETKR